MIRGRFGARRVTTATGCRVPVTGEFVPANPTGPLHASHVACGAALWREPPVSILAVAGYLARSSGNITSMTTAARMDILAVCVWLRYLELCGEKHRFPWITATAAITFTTSRGASSARESETAGGSRGRKWNIGCPLSPDKGGDGEVHPMP